MKRKNSNIFSDKGKYSVKIYDGMTLLCASNMFESPEAARDSAKRLIKYQEKLLNTNTAYAMVFDSKKMLYYFD